MIQRQADQGHIAIRIARGEPEREGDHAGAFHLLAGQPLGRVLLWAAAVGLAALVGHLWPLFFRFKGGKGVATAAGVLMAFNPLLGVATLATWAIVALFFRYSSLASIAAAVFAPFYQALIWDADVYALAIAAMSLLLRRITSM